MTNKHTMWYSIPGNPYMVNISPLMLLPGGYVIERSIKNKQTNQKEVAQVCYDKQFVIQSIISTIINPLNDIDNSLIIELFDEALEFHRWLETAPTPNYATSKNKSFYLWEQFQTYKDALKDLE